MNFDIIAVSETRITKNNLNNSAFEFTPTESSAEGTLIYVANHLAYKPWTDLQIYKKRDLESTFIEVTNPKKSNIIAGWIYRHPNMDLNKFNSDYLKKQKQNSFGPICKYFCLFYLQHFIIILYYCHVFYYRFLKIECRSKALRVRRFETILGFEILLPSRE